jgi:hypothetical protein
MRVDPTGADQCYPLAGERIKSRTWSTDPEPQSSGWRLDREATTYVMGQHGEIYSLTPLQPPGQDGEWDLLIDDDDDPEVVGLWLEVTGIECVWRQMTWKTWSEVTEEDWRIDLICFDCEGKPYRDTDYDHLQSTKPYSTDSKRETTTTIVPLNPPDIKFFWGTGWGDSMDPSDAEKDLCNNNKPKEPGQSKHGV